MEHLALMNSEEIQFQTLQEFCMFCLVKSDSLQIIQNIPRTDLFWKLTGVKVKPFWPQKLCQICMRTFNSISKFVNQIKGNTTKYEQLCQEKFQVQTVAQIREQIFQTETVNSVNSNGEEECLKKIDAHNEELKTEIFVEEPQIQEVDTNCAKSEVEEEDPLTISEETQILNNEEISTDCTIINESIHTTVNNDNADDDDESEKNKAESIFHQKIYKCTICHKELASKFKLQYHRIKYHKKPVEFQCFICNRVFKSKPYMKRHISRVHLQIKKFKCEICGKAFDIPGKLKEHKNIHTGHKPFICTYCGKGFAKYSNLLPHDRYHKLVNGEVQQDETTKYYLRLKCDLCEIIFRCPTALTRHEKKCGKSSVPDDKKNKEKFLCFVCGQEFRYEFRLKNHIRRFHSEEKSDENDKSENNAEKGNSDEILLKCCGKTFMSKHGFKNHERMHFAIRKYECSICDKSFKLPQILKSHERTHTGEKKFKCSMCDMGYANYNSFQKHKKTHAKISPLSSLEKKEV